MFKRDSAFFLVDIFIASNKIERYTKRFENASSLLESELEWDATMRELEIIGEATNALLKMKVLEGRKFRRIVDFRNVLIHAYFGIDEDEVFEVVREKLPSFTIELAKVIKQQNIYMLEALECAIEENSKNSVLVKALKELKEKHSD